MDTSPAGMTLAEKAALGSGQSFWQTKSVAGALS